MDVAAARHVLIAYTQPCVGRLRRPGIKLVGLKETEARP